MEVAQKFSVATPINGVVLYSVSFLPTQENKELAFAYLKEHPEAMMIDQTECGQELIKLGLLNSSEQLSAEQTATIWKVASKRMISEARGNVVAFVKDADIRSVFRSTELPEILNNPHIPTINGIDKHLFAKNINNLTMHQHMLKVRHKNK